MSESYEKIMERARKLVTYEGTISPKFDFYKEQQQKMITMLEQKPPTEEFKVIFSPLISAMNVKMAEELFFNKVIDSLEGEI